MNFIVLFAFGGWEIILIIAVILLIFGGKKIPELMKGIGKGMTEFKKARAEDQESENTENKEKK